MRSVFVAALLATSSCALPDAPPIPKPAVVERGAPGGGGRLVALQVFVDAADYASAERFGARLRALFEAAADAGALDERTVVVLPEYVGTWLVAEGEGAGVFESETLGGAMTGLALAHLPSFLWASFRSPAAAADAFAAFTVKAERMAAVYGDVMARLADDFDVTLVAGSIVLPGARLADGALVVAPGAPLENVSVVFGADGAPLAIARKAFPTADETGFMAAAAPGGAVVETPAGTLAVLVCADAWFPQSYARLAEQGVELLAVPTFHSGGAKDGWEQPWGGYSGQAAPADVDEDADVGAISEREAWEKHAFPSRARAAGVRAAISAPLRGTLWDLGDDGEAFLVDAFGHARGPRDDAPAILVLHTAPGGA